MLVFEPRTSHPHVVRLLSQFLCPKGSAIPLMEKLSFDLSPKYLEEVEKIEDKNTWAKLKCCGVLHNAILRITDLLVLT